MQFLDYAKPQPEHVHRCWLPAVTALLAAAVTAATVTATAAATATATATPNKRQYALKISDNGQNCPNGSRDNGATEL